MRLNSPSMFASGVAVSFYLLGLYFLGLFVVRRHHTGLAPASLTPSVVLCNDSSKHAEWPVWRIFWLRCPWLTYTFVVSSHTIQRAAKALLVKNKKDRRTLNSWPDCADLNVCKIRWLVLKALRLSAPKFIAVNCSVFWTVLSISKWAKIEGDHFTGAATLQFS